MQNSVLSRYQNFDISDAYVSQFTPLSVTGFIYLIQFSNEQIFKIGLTTDLKSRLSGIQSGSPYKLTANAVFVVRHAPALVVETLAHKVAAERGSRMSGEWFEITNNDALQSIEKAGTEAGAKLLTTDQLIALTKKKTDYEHAAHKANLKSEDEARRAALRVKLGIE